MSAPFRRSGQGYAVALDPAIRSVVRSVLGEMRDLVLLDDEASLRRLYPPAYPGDDDRDREYRELVHGDLLERRLTAIDTVERTIDATTLTGEELEAWVGAINDARLVLGTRLDIDEDSGPVPADHPEAVAHEVYALLSELLYWAVEAISGGR